MLDAVSILVSCGACCYVAWRAAKLDKSMPWFLSLGRSAPRRWQRRSGARKPGP